MMLTLRERQTRLERAASELRELAGDVASEDRDLAAQALRVENAIADLMAALSSRQDSALAV